MKKLRHRDAWRFTTRLATERKKVATMNPNGIGAVFRQAFNARDALIE
jgi:hypothetical protein